MTDVTEYKCPLCAQVGQELWLVGKRRLRDHLLDKHHMERRSR